MDSSSSVKSMEEEIVWDDVSPNHHGPDQVHMTRVLVADWVRAAGHKRVLDLPCFMGRMTKLLLDRGLNVTSADLNPEQFRIPGRTCVRADLHTTLPFQDGEFDALVCVEGIEHIEDQHQVVREASRILQRGGMFYISTPNVLSIRSRLSYLLRGYPNYFHYMIEIDPSTGKEKLMDHIRPVGYLELRYMLSRWGFLVDKVTANRYVKPWSPLYNFIRLVMHTKGRRWEAQHPAYKNVRRTLLSKELLFGEALIMVATKVGPVP